MDIYQKYKIRYRKIKKIRGGNSSLFLPLFDKYSTYSKRKNELQEILKDKINLNKKICMIGFGAVGRLLMVFLLKKIIPSEIHIIEERNVSDDIKKINHNIEFHNVKLTKDNYINIFNKIGLGENDLIIDTAFSIDTCDIMDICNERKINYINSCIQMWDCSVPYNKEDNEKSNEDNNNIKYSLYTIHKNLEKKQLKNCNFLISMGCNPGNVSIWNKIAMKHMATINNINSVNYNEIAQKMDIKTIHISERDTQLTKKPKQIDEYVNTWSMLIEPYYSELYSVIEGSWGTHETNVTRRDIIQEDSYMIGKNIGAYTNAYSYVPIYGRYIGNIICHDEAYTIGNTLSVYDNNKKLIYKPSVYYVYHPTDSTVMAVNEMKDKNTNKEQSKYRLLSDDIIEGKDILGLTYYCKDKVYWIGSLLDIKEARDLFDNEYLEWINATNVQVVAGYFTGIMYLLDNLDRKMGLIDPDYIPEKYMKYQLPLLGDFIFTEIKVTEKSDWKIDDFIC